MNGTDVQFEAFIIFCFGIYLSTFTTSVTYARPGDTHTTSASELSSQRKFYTSLNQEIFPPAEGDVRLRVHLEMLAEASRSGDLEQIDLATSLVEEARDALGASNFILASTFLLQEARDFSRQKKWRWAIYHTQQAIRLSPDLLGGHWVYISLLIKKSPFRVALISKAMTDMIFAWIRSFRNQVYIIYFFVSMIFYGSVGAWTLFVCVLFFRYSHCLAHDLLTPLPRFFGPGEVVLALALLIALPAILRFGWPASIALGVGFSLAYQTFYERGISLLGMTLVGAAPWLVQLATPLVAFPGSRIDHLAAVIEQAQPESSVAILKKYGEKKPSDGLAHLTLGGYEARRGRNEQALHHLELAVNAPSPRAEALNNLGVLRYKMGLHEIGEKHLQRARQLGELSSVNLNLSLIYQLRGNVAKAQELSYQVQHQAPAEFRKFQASDGAPIEERLVFVDVPESLLWAELLSMTNQEVSATEADLWETLVDWRVPRLHLPAWSLFSLALGLLGFLNREHSHACTKCGTPTYASQSDVLHCSQCRSIFSSAKAIAPATRQAKERQVRLHHLRKRWRDGLSGFVPGLNPLLRGEACVPNFFVMMTFVSLLSVPTIAKNGLQFHAWYLPGDGMAYAVITGIILAVGGLLSFLSLRAASGR